MTALPATPPHAATHTCGRPCKLSSRCSVLLSLLACMLSSLCLQWFRQESTVESSATRSVSVSRTPSKTVRSRFCLRLNCFVVYLSEKQHWARTADGDTAVWSEEREFCRASRV